jgi:ATP-dependent Clp endopeptidase proteolytic subunit ClpP
MPAELAELLREAEELRRSTHAVPPVAQAPPWFRIEAKADDPKTADVWIYDRIGSDFFDEGVSAKAFVRQVNALKVEQIVLHINSPGGDFFQGVAIYNALRDHPATVTAIVDGLAASAASFVFQAGDTRRVNRAGQVMIHDASGGVLGNAKDMADFAAVLDRISDSMAGIYADRGGGTVADWREAMQAETWYSAVEAVEAGLADEAMDDAPAEPPVSNHFDLAIFAYAGRAKAPAPVMPSASARTQTPEPAGPGTTTEGGAVADNAKLREALGLKADASDDEVRAAWASSGLAAQPAPADPPQPPAPNPPADPPANPPDPDAPLPPQQVTASGRVRVVDAAVWEKLNEQAGKVDQLVQERQREKRDQVIADAMRAGKFGPAEKEQYQKLWDQAPKETEGLIATLTPNRIAVSASGYVGLDPDEAAEDAMFDELFPPEMRYGKAGSRG